MNTTVSSSESQIVRANVCVDMADCAMDQVEALRSILAMIARIATDDDLRSLAIHGKHVAAALHNDIDVFREAAEQSQLAA